MMEKKYLKTVLLPIKVPEGEYCLYYHYPRVCEYFDNDSGDHECKLGFDIRETIEGIGVKKPSRCIKLLSIEVVEERVSEYKQLESQTPKESQERREYGIKIYILEWILRWLK